MHTLRHDTGDIIMCVHFLCKTNCIKVMLVKYQYTHKNITQEFNC